MATSHADTLQWCITCETCKRRRGILTHGRPPWGRVFLRYPMPYTRSSPNFTAFKTHQSEIDTPTDKHVLLINEYTRKVVSLSPTVAGKTHDKKAVDEADLVYPVHSTLDKDTGCQGYEPAGVRPQQPQKSPEARS